MLQDFTKENGGTSCVWLLAKLKKENYPAHSPIQDCATRAENFLGSKRPESAGLLTEGLEKIKNEDSTVGGGNPRQNRKQFNFYQALQCCDSENSWHPLVACLEFERAENRYREMIKAFQQVATAKLLHANLSDNTKQKQLIEKHVNAYQAVLDEMHAVLDLQGKSKPVNAKTYTIFMRALDMQSGMLLAAIEDIDPTAKTRLNKGERSTVETAFKNAPRILADLASAPTPNKVFSAMLTTIALVMGVPATVALIAMVLILTTGLAIPTLGVGLLPAVFLIMNLSAMSTASVISTRSLLADRTAGVSPEVYAAVTEVQDTSKSDAKQLRNLGKESTFLPNWLTSLWHQSQQGEEAQIPEMESIESEFDFI